MTPTIERHDIDVPRFAPTRLISHGMILRGPSRKPVGTSHATAYELGHCLQLDARHCLLLASLDEQGGGDLCVGNDAFVFERLSDIQADSAISVNRVETDYQLPNGRGSAFLAKFPAMAGFVPLGARLEGGADHPGAGTGFLICTCVTFSADKTSAIEAPETFLELIQIRWDGVKVEFFDPVYVRQLLGMPLSGDKILSPFCPQDQGLLVALGVSGQGIGVFRFEFDGQRWAAVTHGRPFCTNPEADRPTQPGEPWKRAPGEVEPSLRRARDRYVLFTRGIDPIGRLYESTDGLNYRLVLERPNVTVPQVLNQGLDGSLYLATNPGPGWLRNPLVAYDFLTADAAPEGMILHDQDGVRDGDGPTIPFVDHAVSFNVLLDGQWRHLVFYRVCDLKERTLHKFQLDQGQGKGIYGDQGPIEKRSTTGLYLVEMEFERMADAPVLF